MDTEADREVGKTPFWGWAAAGGGIAAALLGAWTFCVFEIDAIGERATAQHRQLQVITAGLEESITALRQHHGRIFDSTSRGEQSFDGGSVPWSYHPSQGDHLPEPVQRQLISLKNEFGRCVAQAQASQQWHNELTRAARQRQTTAQHTQSTLESLRRQVGELIATERRRSEQLFEQARAGDPTTGLEATRTLLSTHSPSREQTLRQLDDALDELDKQIVRAAEEPNERRFRKLRVHQLLRTLEYLDSTLEAVWHELGEEVEAPLRAAASSMRTTLGGSNDASSPDWGQGGSLGSHLDWVVHRGKGVELADQASQQIGALHRTRAELEELMAAVQIVAHEETRAWLHQVWVGALVLGAILTLVLLAIAHWIHRRVAMRMHELVATQQSALDAVKAQSAFLANMSHEIRTPMNGVLGMAEILETGVDNEHQHIARTIRTSAEALLTVINDILDFSKIQEGKLELDATDFDLRNTIDDTFDLLGHLATNRGNELLCWIDHSVPRFVRGDSDRLRQILLNLTGNAVKFTQDGEITVLVDLLNQHRDVARLQVSVTDTGVGISQKAQARLFSPFRQADSSTARRFGGTGLGLTISKRLIQLMDGDISVRSELGVGSTFTFTLTLQCTENPEPREEAADFSGHSALVVDENEAHRELVAMQLARWKMGFDLAENAEQALETMRRAVAHGHRFDLVLLDHEIPGTDGLSLARQLAEDPDLATSRRILLSPSGSKPADASLGELHVDAWLAKPVRDSRLKACFRKLLKLAPPHALAAESGDSDDTGTFAAAEDAPLGYHVLVAEDNAINQRVMREMLKREGCTTVFVSDGAEALEAVRKQKFDVVLMDCQMPVMDGLVATRTIRELGPPYDALPILALTANVLPADRRDCAEAGMNDFLSKPVKKNQLRNALLQWAGAAETPAG